jgi:hypothetical protein
VRGDLAKAASGYMGSVELFDTLAPILEPAD